jgi:hypothetical protein
MPVKQVKQEPIESDKDMEEEKVIPSELPSILKNEKNLELIEFSEGTQHVFLMNGLKTFICNVNKEMV